MDKEAKLLYNLGRLVGLLQGKQILNMDEFAFAKEVLDQIQETLSYGIANSKYELET